MSTVQGVVLNVTLKKKKKSSNLNWIAYPGICASWIPRWYLSLFSSVNHESKKKINCSESFVYHFDRMMVMQKVSSIGPSTLVLALTTGLFTLMRDSWRPQCFYVALCEKCAKQEIPRGHWCIHKLLQAQICWILHFTISFFPARGTCRSSLTLLRDWILDWKNFVIASRRRIFLHIVERLMFHFGNFWPHDFRGVLYNWWIKNTFSKMQFYLRCSCPAATALYGPGQRTVRF